MRSRRQEPVNRAPGQFFRAGVAKTPPGNLQLRKFPHQCHPPELGGDTRGEILADRDGRGSISAVLQSIAISLRSAAPLFGLQAGSYD
jgi:hypothetical protein